MQDDKKEWDDKKAKINEIKHQLTFEEADEVFLDPFAIEKFDDKNSTLEEERYIVLGRIKNQLVVVVVHTSRDEKRRIISARYATSKERQVYYDRLRKSYF